MAILAKNKEVFFNYEIQRTMEAGIVLLGHEVKSVKTGHISLKSAYVTMRGGEAVLINAHISAYKFAGKLKNYDPYRSRKLLLHRKQLNELIGKSKADGLTLVPLKIYVRKGRIKLEIGIARGKKKYDKREAIRKREITRKIQRAIKR